MRKIASNDVRLRIHERIRKNLTGTESRPRLCVFRSNKHIYAQIVDDSKGTTVTAASTLDAATKGQLKNGGNIAAARAVGKIVAERALEKVSRPSFSTAADTSITVALRPWPMPHAKRG